MQLSLVTLTGTAPLAGTDRPKVPRFPAQSRSIPQQGVTARFVKNPRRVAILLMGGDKTGQGDFCAAVFQKCGKVAVNRGIWGRSGREDVMTEIGSDIRRSI